MRMRAGLASMIVAGLLAAPAAQAMSVAEFLARARQLQAVGVLAPFYADYDLLKAEMRGIAYGYLADIAAARRAGRPPHSCPPPRNSPAAQIDPEQLLRELERIPPAQRGVSMKTAFYAFMKRRFPCKA
jgi:hypothetical protein